MKKLGIILILAVLLCGCSKESKEGTEPIETSTFVQSTIEEAVILEPPTIPPIHAEVEYDESDEPETTTEVVDEVNDADDVDVEDIRVEDTPNSEEESIDESDDTSGTLSFQTVEEYISVDSVEKVLIDNNIDYEILEDGTGYENNPVIIYTFNSNEIYILVSYDYTGALIQYVVLGSYENDENLEILDDNTLLVYNDDKGTYSIHMIRGNVHILTEVNGSDYEDCLNHLLDMWDDIADVAE